MDILQAPTPSTWLPVALADFDAVLLDHAHCEKKAAASALAMVQAYPDRSELVRRCIGLAQEELRHFRQVHRILLARGLVLQRDSGDPYAQALLKHVRTGKQERMIDKLLVSSLIEARSCERLRLLGEGLEDPELAHFYKGLATAEAGHHRLFVKLAERYASEDCDVPGRLQDLARLETEIMLQLPVEPRIH